MKWFVFGAGIAFWLIGVIADKSYLLPASIIMGLCVVANSIDERKP